MATAYQLLVVPAVILFKFLLGMGISSFPAKGVSWTDATKWHHPTIRMEEMEIHALSLSKPYNYDRFNQTLDAILKPRVVGTPMHVEVQMFIKSAMNTLDWTVEEDSFTDRTPHGVKPFNNIIATLNPNACRRLVIACHYDSMYNREYTFYGATDSAVPCSMMINAAEILDRPLKEQREKNNELSIQFIFFDGEEAFKRWSRTDSLYGSRHLAAKWNRMKPFPNGVNNGKHCVGRDYSSYLDRMEVMVLLDLIGTANPKFFSYFPDTSGLYSQLIEIEKRLNSLHLMEAHPPQSQTEYFDSRASFAFVQDDHIPFMQKGVPIIHLIPSPFPSVWHSESDNRESLHHPTINNLNKILRIFIAQYLHLDLGNKIM